MPYKHGRPVIDLSLPFRIASFLGFYLAAPIAYLFNVMRFSAGYKYRFKLLILRKAITVSNHCTFLDPVNVGAAVFPRRIYQTLLESTVEFPVLGTFTRIMGGVPIPRGKSGYHKIIEICGQAFKHHRYLHFYPEGECYLYSQQIRKFHSGAFRISAELDIPVVPLVTVFSNGLYKPRSLLGRAVPVEKVIVLDPVYPAQFVRRDENGEISSKSIKEFAEAVRQKMQAEIDSRKGSDVFYRGRMERIKGLNDDTTAPRPGAQ